ncbi:MAG: GTPase Era [Gemmatimonadetes bacterium]|nr:GTPase Era [Gemmatimonadota bacterium]
MEESEETAAPLTTRAGHVALIGRPNVGKSTLLNAFMGEKLSIVTPKAQTTRESVTGILTTDTAQAIFVDTPGLLEPKYALQRAMHETALEVIADADLVLLLLDATRPGELPPDGTVLNAIRRRRDAILVIINKIDEGSSDAVEALKTWTRDTFGLEAVPISASRGDGVAELRSAIEAGLPENPFFYPEDELAVQPVRFFVTELIRETIFEMYEQEVPYATIVRVEEYRESDDPVFIRATVYVERESQKPIVIGKGGAGIRDLGSRSRAKIEAFIGQRVYLDLFVKTLPNWRAKLGTLRYLGYRLPPALAHEEPGEDQPGTTDGPSSSAATVGGGDAAAPKRPGGTARAGSGPRNPKKRSRRKPKRSGD